MPEAKTKPTSQNVSDFLNTVEPEQKRKDSFELLKIFQEVTKEKPVMWGPSIVGFGKYHYKYASGHEGDSCLTGFSPRKQSLTLYVMGGIEHNQDLLQKLGKHKVSPGCVYIKKLEDIDTVILKQLIKKSVFYVQQKYL